MREFNETDKKKKKKRVEIPENPANLSPKDLAKLENDVKAALRDGYLSCPVAWSLAKKAGVPRIAVGSITDKLGVRITDCQLGCFKVDKTLYTGPASEDLPQEMIEKIISLNDEGKLTCEKAHELAHEYRQKPMTIGHETIARDIKIRQCQLGCF